MDHDRNNKVKVPQTAFCCTRFALQMAVEIRSLSPFVVSRLLVHVYFGPHWGWVARFHLGDTMGWLHFTWLCIQRGAIFPPKWGAPSLCMFAFMNFALLFRGYCCCDCPELVNTTPRVAFWRGVSIRLLFSLDATATAILCPSSSLRYIFHAAQQITCPQTRSVDRFDSNVQNIPSIQSQTPPP